VEDAHLRPTGSSARRPVVDPRAALPTGVKPTADGRGARLDDGARGEAPPVRPGAAAVLSRPGPPACAASNTQRRRPPPPRGGLRQAGRGAPRPGAAPSRGGASLGRRDDVGAVGPPGGSTQQRAVLSLRRDSSSSSHCASVQVPVQAQRRRARGASGSPAWRWLAGQEDDVVEAEATDGGAAQLLQRTEPATRRRRLQPRRLAQARVPDGQQLLGVPESIRKRRSPARSPRAGRCGRTGAAACPCPRPCPCSAPSAGQRQRPDQLDVVRCSAHLAAAGHAGPSSSTRPGTCAKTRCLASERARTSWAAAARSTPAAACQ